MNIQDIVNLLRRKPEAMSLAEEKIYEIVAAEVATKNIRPGVYAKAFSESNGDTAKATAIYISYRVEQIKDEIEIMMQEAARQAAAQAARIQIRPKSAIEWLKEETGQDAVTFAAVIGMRWICVCGTENPLDRGEKIQNCLRCHRNRDFGLANHSEQSWENAQQ